MLATRRRRRSTRSRARLANRSLRAPNGTSPRAGNAAADAASRPRTPGHRSPTCRWPSRTTRSSTDERQGLLGLRLHRLRRHQRPVRYDPDAGSWTKLASAADTREDPAHGVIGGKFYAAGGWGAPVPRTPSWRSTTRPPTPGRPARQHPKPYAGSGSAVLDGKLYVGRWLHRERLRHHRRAGLRPGGQHLGHRSRPTRSRSPGSPAAPSTASSTAPVAPPTQAAPAHAYVYDPAADAWSPIADLPIDLWGSGVHRGQRHAAGLRRRRPQNSSALTNQGFAYDPASDAWTALPNSNNSLYRGGGACGFYKVGGNPGGSLAPPVAASEVLPGLRPRWAARTSAGCRRARPTVTLAAGRQRHGHRHAWTRSVPEITQPGDAHRRARRSAPTRRTRCRRWR